MSVENELPKGWCWTTVEQIVDERRAITYGVIKLGDPVLGGIPILRSSNVRHLRFDLESLKSISPDIASEYGRTFLQGGEILVTVRGTLGGVAVVPSNFAGYNISREVAMIACILPSIAVCLAFFIGSPPIQSWMTQNTKGIAYTGINIETLKGMPVPLPPLAEQQRIVEVIEQQFSRLDAGIALLRQAQKKLKLYRASVLKAAVDGELTAEWRATHPDSEPASELLKRILAERRAKWEEEQLVKMREKGIMPKDDKWKQAYKEPQGPDVGGLEKLPEGWCWTAVGQIAWSVKDGPHYSPKYVDSGIPFITGGNVRSTGIDFISARQISPELHAELSKRCQPEKGDILYTKGGTTGIARVNTYDIDFSVWVHVAVLKLAKSIEPFYVQHSLNSLHCYTQAQKFTRGVGNQDLGLTRMINITLPLPPLVEQEQIILLIEERMSIINDLEITIEKALKQAERQRQSILHQAFTGQLVPQDPTDEPASVLLERIRQERQQEQPVKPEKQKISPKTVRSKKAPRMAKAVQMPDGPVEPIDITKLTQGNLWQQEMDDAVSEEQEDIENNVCQNVEA